MTQGSKPICRKIYQKVTHCIFDLDGTLLDSEVMYHDMIRQICSKYGKIYNIALQMRVFLFLLLFTYIMFVHHRFFSQSQSHLFSLGPRRALMKVEFTEATTDSEISLQLRRAGKKLSKMYGVTDKEMCLTITKELNLPISTKEFQWQLNQLASRMLPKAPLQKGVERLLTHFHHMKVPMAVATNSSESCVNMHFTARPKLFQVFHHTVSSTDPEVNEGKPSPDVYLVAASRFPEKPKPIQCLVFEDSVIGVQAATGAGMQVVLIVSHHLNAHKSTSQPTLVLHSLTHFKPEVFGLPSFKIKT